MPIGRYKGTPMANLNAYYLLEYYGHLVDDGSRIFTRDEVNVREYIKENLQVLKKEAGRK